MRAPRNLNPSRLDAEAKPFVPARHRVAFDRPPAMFYGVRRSCQSVICSLLVRASLSAFYHTPFRERSSCTRTRASSPSGPPPSLR